MVEIGVFDMSGRIVGLLAHNIYGPGTHSLEWNGRDSSGHPVSSGTYLVRMETKDHVESRKVMLVR